MSNQVSFKSAALIAAGSAVGVVSYNCFGTAGLIVPPAMYLLHGAISQCTRPQNQSSTSSTSSSLGSRVLQSPVTPSTSSRVVLPAGMSAAASSGSSSSSVPDLKKIARDNGFIAKAKEYSAPSGKLVTVHVPQENDRTSPSMLVDPTYKGRQPDYTRIVPGYQEVRIDGRVEVVNEECLNYLLNLQDAGWKPCLLNMANQTSPGGGYLHGSRAQEEDICRRSMLYNALLSMKGAMRFRRYQLPTQSSVKGTSLPKDYFIPESGCMLSSNVQVIRDDRYQLLEDPRHIDVISSAAYNLNTRHKFNLEYLQETADVEGKSFDQVYRERTKEKIKTILNTAILSGHNAVVLSAFGCGAFFNNPEVVAQLFKEVLEESPAFLKGKNYREAIKVIFAIIGDRNDKKGNFQAFQRCFATA